ncbi:MAG TPA: hypothetical protein VLC52_14275, partial [Anaerolineae bacterium]|nr:hypothetical protein [Anaerolineae bacterium]
HRLLKNQELHHNNKNDDGDQENGMHGYSSCPLIAWPAPRRHRKMGLYTTLCGICQLGFWYYEV